MLDELFKIATTHKNLMLIQLVSKLVFQINTIIHANNIFIC